MIELLQRELSSESESPSPSASSSSAPLDPRVLSSVLISVKLAQANEESSGGDPHARLLELMHSSPIRALLDSAQLFAQREGIAAQDGLQQLVLSLQEIDRLWNKVLIKEGLNRLSSQYH
jgi:hypothetical protein